MLAMLFMPLIIAIKTVDFIIFYVFQMCRHCPKHNLLIIYQIFLKHAGDKDRDNI